MTKRVLVIAPHPDDETLGAGGTIAKCSSRGDDVAVLIVSGHLPPLYPREHYDTTVAEAKGAFEILGVSRSWFLEVPATMIGDQPISVLNRKIGEVVAELEPQIVLCPYWDRHIDHRLVFDSVMVTTRPVGPGRRIEIVAAYETLSETHWNAPQVEPNFVPNWVVDISAELPRKLEAAKCYRSQIPPFPGARSIEAIDALARFRGTQAGFAAGEGFHVIRMIS
ncbi:MAG TPA: PIG-L family deacetylase [Vicinamibacterales bacterium]|nr:PIG-L family deacetylase [Vicinamibacterales bacterium]